jgi:hypothetical protein
MSENGESKITEKMVVGLWQQMTRVPARLQDSQGRPLTVVYAGRPNDQRGADFRDAVIISPEGRRQGCIEIHTLTSGWQAHGHHLDPHYDKVVLQVAWQADRGVPAHSASGRRIPTVVLQGQTSLAAAGAGRNCRQLAAAESPPRLGAILEAAGRQRLALKSRAFQSQMEVLPPAEVLYQGLARALGYSQNQAAFADLAQRWPLSRCYPAIRAAGPPDIRTLQSFLLGQAALLPSQRGWALPADPYIQSLEQIWRSSRWAPLASAPPWEFFRVRPANSPVRRLMALSYWLWEDRLRNWSDCFRQPVEQLPPSQALAVLSQNLAASDQAYWAGHYDFERPCRPPRPSLLGPDRRGEMLVNVLLPFLLAWANRQEQPVLAARLAQLYAAAPALAPNSIQRHMSAQMRLPPRSLSSACRQQGLIHIYKTSCSQGSCQSCPLAV